MEISGHNSNFPGCMPIESFHNAAETEAETASDLVTLNFELHDGSSLQIIVRKDVLDCISLYWTNIGARRRGSFPVFLIEKEAGIARDKGLFSFW